MSASPGLLNKYGAISAGEFENGRQSAPSQAAPSTKTVNPHGAIPAAQFEKDLPQQSPQMLGGGAQAPNMSMTQRILERLAQGAQPINNLGDATTRGLVQGTYSGVRSLANALPDTLNIAGGFAQGQGMPTLPQLQLNGKNLRDTIHSDPLSQLAFTVSDLGAQTLTAGGVERGLSKVPGLAGRSLSKLVARGATTGYLTGDEAPGGRMTGAVAGGVAGPLYNLTSSKVAGGVAGARDSAMSKYNNLYEDWFSKANSAAPGAKLDVPNLDLDSLKSLNKSTKHLKSIKKFQENPTFQNAHKAQSDLGKLARNTSDSAIAAKGSLSDAEHAGVAAAEQARDAIEGAGLKKLIEIKRPELADQYLGIKKGYSEEVVPYLKPAIKNYSKGKISAEDMLSQLSSDPFFKMTAQKNHPDFMLYQKYGNQLPQLAKSGLNTAAKVGGGAAVLKGLGLYPSFGGRGDSDNSGSNQ